MPLSTEISPTPELQTQQLQEDTLQAPRADFSLLSPSARTSFTRVDVCAENDQEGAAANRQAPLTDTSDVQTEGEAQVVPQTPQTSLTFLLVSGRRRTMQFDPETTIGRAKELVWNAWPNGKQSRQLMLENVDVPYRYPFMLCSAPSIVLICLVILFLHCIFSVCSHLSCTEWQDERPPAPSYLRILYLGKILQDEDTLISELLRRQDSLHDDAHGMFDLVCRGRISGAHTPI